MRILVTSSRMPFAVDEIRKLGRQGHTVWAADSFRLAPGNHSEVVTESLVVPAPRFAPGRFVDALARVASRERIELLLPTFEESFVLSKHRARFEPATRVFTADFETLDTLHNKARFFELLDEIGLPTLPTRVAHDQAGLREAVNEHARWVARAVYSRGSVDVLTHDGALAGELRLQDCEPTVERPWIVQPFLDGHELCSFSLVHQGVVTAHCAYEHPRTIEDGGGISFTSVEAPETLALARRVAAHTGYTGQLSFDYIAADEGLHAIECNPRATDGVVLMERQEFERGLLAGREDEPVLVPAGRRRQITAGVLRELLAHFGRMLAEPGELRQALSELVNIRGVYADRGDPGPALVLPLSYSHVLGYRNHQSAEARSRSSVMGAYLYDVSWNGEDLP